MHHAYVIMMAEALGTSENADDATIKVAHVLALDDPDFNVEEFFKAVIAHRLLSVTEEMNEGDVLVVDTRPDDGPDNTSIYTINLGLN